MQLIGVFPAYVGMSPSMDVFSVTLYCVPRIRGDEPGQAGKNVTGMMCSPHTWG